LRIGKAAGTMLELYRFNGCIDVFQKLLISTDMDDVAICEAVLGTYMAIYPGIREASIVGMDVKLKKGLLLLTQLPTQLTHIVLRKQYPLYFSYNDLAGIISAGEDTVNPVVLQDIQTEEGVLLSNYNPTSSMSYSFSDGRREVQRDGSVPSSSHRGSRITEGNHSSDRLTGTISHSGTKTNIIENPSDGKRKSEWLCVEMTVPGGYHWHQKPHVKRLFACIARFKPIRHAIGSIDEKHQYNADKNILMRVVNSFSVAMQVYCEKIARMNRRKDLLKIFEARLHDWRELEMDEICSRSIDYVMEVLPGANLYTAIFNIEKPVEVIDEEVYMHLYI
jgi:hypothetical protein